MSTVRFLALFLFTFSLQVTAGVDRSFAGEGSWSASAGNSGAFTSQLRVGWLSGIKLGYRVELDSGEGFSTQLIIQPHSDDTCNALTLEKRTLGPCRYDEARRMIIINYTQDSDEIELGFVMRTEGEADITIKKTTSDGNTITWQDKLSEVSAE